MEPPGLEFQLQPVHLRPSVDRRSAVLQELARVGHETVPIRTRSADQQSTDVQSQDDEREPEEAEAAFPVDARVAQTVAQRGRLDHRSGRLRGGSPPESPLSGRNRRGQVRRGQIRRRGFVAAADPRRGQTTRFGQIGPKRNILDERIAQKRGVDRGQRHEIGPVDRRGRPHRRWRGSRVRLRASLYHARCCKNSRLI